MKNKYGNIAKSGEKVLGVKWDENKDTLIIEINDILQSWTLIITQMRNVAKSAYFRSGS